MNNKTKFHVYVLAFASFLFLSSGTTSVLAGDFQDPPKDFLFGNHIDTHQEAKLKLTKDDKPKSLSGSIYIIFTGDIDPVSGLPIARHPRGASEGEDCNDKATGCVEGWKMKGVPGVAKFLYHRGVNGDDHPVWMVDRVDIPQPGSYTFFHWITRTSNDPRYDDVLPACDKNNAGQLESEAPSAVDAYCQGWFLEIKAKKKFAFQHGNEIIPVNKGDDNSSHLNLVTNYAVVEGITRTRNTDEE